MRVTWADSFTKDAKQLRYRKHTISRHKGGWVIDLPGDRNIYRNWYCAENAIDAVLGGDPPPGPSYQRRKKYGIQIIGQREDI